MTLQTVFVLLLAALNYNSAYKLDELKTWKTGDLTIFRGTPVKISEVPFVARLVCQWGPACGAAIITEKFLLTSAECANLTQNVVVGSDNLDSGDKYDIKQFHSHPDYRRDGFPGQFDIAVIELVKNLTFGDTVQPIALAEPDMKIEDDALFETLGFGFTERYEQSHELLKENLPYVPAIECAETWKREDVEITDNMICAGGTDGRGPCSGDVGGPLVYKDRLVGLTTLQYQCGLKGIPAVYARISALRSFIDGIVN